MCVCWGVYVGIFAKIGMEMKDTEQKKVRPEVNRIQQEGTKLYLIGVVA